MFSASKVESQRSRSSFNRNRPSLQPNVRTKAVRSSSVDVRGRGTYVPPKKRTSSEDRSKLSTGCAKRSLGWFSDSRKSSINLAEGKGIMKDPRPLNDRSYQKTQIQELLQLLEQVDFKSSVTEASLLSPNKKDFELIFKCLYSLLDPEYVMQKFEEDVLKILKWQHYPFTVNKSALAYVAKHNWPTLLGILFWLSNICKFLVNFDTKTIFSSGDGERAHENSILAPYICSAYFNGSINEEEEKRVYAQIVRSRKEENLEDLKKKYEDNKAVLEKLQEKYNAVQDLISENEQLDLKILDYEEYFLKMTQHMQNRIVAREKLVEQLKKQESELEKLKNEISQKLVIYDAQGFDGRKQQQHFNTLKQELHESYEQKEQVFDELKNSCWEKEIQCTETIDKMSSVCDDFNNLYATATESAVNMFDSIKHSKSAKLEKLWKNVYFEFPKLQLSCKYQDMISMRDSGMEALRTLQKSVNDSGNYIQAFTVGQKQYLNNLAVKEAELSFQLKILNSQIEKYEKELNSKREEELQKFSKSNKQYEAKMEELKQLKEAGVKLENVVKEMKLELPRIIEFKHQKEKELKEYMETVRKVYSICDSNWELCKKRAEEHGEDISKKLKKLKDDQSKGRH